MSIYLKNDNEKEEEGPGAWSEGVAYWSYGMAYITALIEAIDRTNIFKSSSYNKLYDYIKTKYPGFERSAEFILLQNSF